jgi:hypothetical protein
VIAKARMTASGAKRSLVFRITTSCSVSSPLTFVTFTLQCAVQPPSTGNATPVIEAAASLAWSTNALLRLDWVPTWPPIERQTPRCDAGILRSVATRGPKAADHSANC